MSRRKCPTCRRELEWYEKECPECSMEWWEETIAIIVLMPGGAIFGLPIIIAMYLIGGVIRAVRYLKSKRSAAARKATP